MKNPLPHDSLFVIEHQTTDSGDGCAWELFLRTVSVVRSDFRTYEVILKPSLADHPLNHPGQKG